MDEYLAKYRWWFGYSGRQRGRLHGIRFRGFWGYSRPSRPDKDQGPTGAVVTTTTTIQDGGYRVMPVLTFDDFAHEYRLDGKKLPSVTSIISTISADTILSSNFKMAGIRGTAVHEVCEKLNKGEQVNISSLPEDINRYVHGYISFLQSGTYEVTHAEQRVYSPLKHYAGTVDIIAKNKKGQYCVMDIKTSSMVSPTAALQMAAYAGALEEMSAKGLLDIPNLKIKERVVIWLTGDDKYQLVPFKDPSDYNVFVCKLVSYNWDIKNGLK